MSARLNRNSYNVSASCPECHAVTTFEQRQSFVVDGVNAWNEQAYLRIVYVLVECAGCHRGGLAIVPDRGSVQTGVLKDFYPFSISSSQLPASVPQDIVAEFREAEKCAAMKMNRAASALYRSVPEKALKANGYTKGNDPSLRDLQKRIDAAAADGIITQARQKRAHDEIRSLGNDVLHDDWRAVTDEEVEESHLYMQRILEDIYDDRATVETLLIAKGRLTPHTPPTTP